MTGALFTKSQHTYLYLRDIKPHPEVQRRFDATWAKKIRDNFDPDKFGELAVVKIGMDYFVFDGQHRAWAARESLGQDQKVPCIVYADMPTERQAELFIGRNASKAVRAIDKFKVALIAQHQAETRIAEILRRFNLRVDDQYTSGVVRAPVALLKVYSTHGEDVLIRALRLISDAWGRDPDAYDGLLLRGISRLLHRFAADIEDRDLARKLARHGGPGKIIGSARDHAKIMSVPVERACAEQMLNIYNKGRRVKVLSFVADTQDTRVRSAA